MDELRTSACPLLPVGLPSLVLDRIGIADDNDHTLAHIIASFAQSSPSWRTVHRLFDVVPNVDESKALRCLKWLHSRTVEPDGTRWRSISIESVLDAAVERGWLSLVEFLVTHYKSECDNNEHRMVTESARHGHLHLLQFLFEHSSRYLQHCNLVFAAGSRNVKVMDFVWEFRQTMRETKRQRSESESSSIDPLIGDATRAMTDAAINGRLDIVQWIHEHVPQLAANVQDFFKRQWYRGLTLEVFKYLHTNGYKGRLDGVLETAAYAGDVEFVKYVHKVKQFEQGKSEEYRSAVDMATFRGHLEVLAFLLDAGYKGSTDLIDEAAVGNHFKVVKYLHKVQPEGGTPRAVTGAAANGNIELLKFLRKHHSDLFTNEAIETAATNGKIKSVKYLHRLGFQVCNHRALPTAIRFGYVDVVKYLMGRMGLSITREALGMEYRPKCLAMLKLLMERRVFDQSPSMFVQYVEDYQDEKPYHPPWEILDYVYDKCVARRCGLRLRTLQQALEVQPTSAMVNYVYSKLNPGEVLDTYTAMDTAARCGLNAAVQLFMVKGRHEYRDVLIEAMKGAYMDLITHLICYGRGWCLQNAYDLAKEHGGSTVIQECRDLLSAIPCPCTECSKNRTKSTTE